MSHDIAWHAAWDKSHNTQMSPLDIAKAGEASDEFLRYLAEQEMLMAERSILSLSEKTKRVML